jgi:hypothetical protein
MLSSGPLRKELHQGWNQAGSPAITGLDAKRQAAAERWLKGRHQNEPTPQRSAERTRDHDYTRETERKDNPDPSRDGPDEDSSTKHSTAFVKY